MPIIFDGTFWSETVIDAWLEWLMDSRMER